MRRASAFGIVCGSALACNSIAGLDRDYTAGSEGAGDAAGMLADGASGTSGGEAGLDGAAEGGVLPAVPCANAPASTVFCWDFENATLTTPPFGFTTYASSGPSSLAVDTSGASGTGGRALHASVSATGSSRSAVLWQTIATPSWTDGKTLTVSFSIRVVRAGTYAVLGAFQFDSREDGLAVFDTVCPAGAPCLDENDQQTRGRNAQGSTTFDPARWYRAEVSLTRGSGGFAGKVLLDGAVLDDRTTGAMPPEVPSSVQLGVGAFYSGSNTGVTEVYLDDILATFE